MVCGHFFTLLAMWVLLILTMARVQGIRVLRSDMTLNEEGQFVTGAKLINTVGNITIKYGISFLSHSSLYSNLNLCFFRNFAVCVRYKFKILGAKFDRSNVVVIEDKPRVHLI